MTTCLVPPSLLSGSYVLIYDNKNSSEDWLDGKITDWFRVTQSVVESKSAAAWRKRARQECKREKEPGREKVSRGK